VETKPVAPGVWQYNDPTTPEERFVLSLILSTIVFFAATYFLKRYLEELGIPKGMTRGALIFALALAISYLVALVVDRLFH
jgi:VIT1/CCC1 family predicted Fe2+/Mn2+ transporter